MRILITGVCGFVGSTIARTWLERGSRHTLLGIDNFVRAGSERNRQALRKQGVTVMHADLRSASDIESLPDADWVIDAAANPSVLAGVDGRTSSRQIIEHNLLGSVNVLEYCRRHGAGLILLSTSRVYSITGLTGLEMEAVDGAYRPAAGQRVEGLSGEGIGETFSTAAPVSLYGATKRASEQLALEYAEAFDLPVRINRCGVLAGAGQFGRPDQGIFSYWIHSWAAGRPLSYIGFNGMGWQVRDCLHPRDLVSLIERQMGADSRRTNPIVNVSGGAASAVSLRQCSEWCARRFGPHEVTAAATERPYDIAWLVLDSRRAASEWGWTPQTPRDAIFNEIADHAAADPGWLELTYD
jgi:CDP-paratose 2-epimerase